MNMPKIAVFCGGISPERDVSLVSGESVAKALEKNFETRLVRLDKNELPRGIDPSEYIVYPAMHGDYGEDGTLQMQLEKAGFSYAGCGPLSSRICMVKPAAKALMRAAGVEVANSLEFNSTNAPTPEMANALFPNGAVLKPCDKGSSVGLAVARDYEGLKEALSGISEGTWMLEELLSGKELSVGVIYGKAAGIVRIIPDGGVYDFKRKYTAGSTVYEYPAKISTAASDAVKEAAEAAFRACGCRDFARVDFILTNETEPKFAVLEINTLPGMTPTSLLPKSASCMGMNFEALCAKLLEGAIERFWEKRGR